MTTSRTYDGFNRLTGISSAPSGASAVSFQYAYNQANQRLAVTNADLSRVDYAYDALGQVTAGRKYWADGGPVAGQQLEWGRPLVWRLGEPPARRGEAANPREPAAPLTSRPEAYSTHDCLRCRRCQIVSDWQTDHRQMSTDHRLLYGGSNPVCLLNSDLSPLATYTWGLDASGTMQGAGGVGGLLATIIHTGTNAGVYFPAYDGNHNVVAYISAATGAIVAEYDYGPFGELLRATGPLAKDFNFLFSTKYYDWETGLYYYGYRYYNPDTGRWLSRDPLSEHRQLEVYSFVHNDPLSHYDYLGLLDEMFEKVNGPDLSVLVNT